MRRISPRIIEGISFASFIVGVKAYIDGNKSQQTIQEQHNTISKWIDKTNELENKVAETLEKNGEQISNNIEIVQAWEKTDKTVNSFNETWNIVRQDPSKFPENFEKLENGITAHHSALAEIADKIKELPTNKFLEDFFSYFSTLTLDQLYIIIHI